MIKAILASFLLAPMALAAQSGTSGAVFHPSQGYGVGCITGPNGKQVSCMPAAAPTCPVSLRALHVVSSGDMVETRGGQSKSTPKPQEIGQRLHLIFTGATHPVVQATINVVGWSPQGRMEEASTKLQKHSSGPDTNPVRTLTVPVTAGAADIWIPGMTAVASIELVSLEYADGSTWTLSSANSCRFVPDPLMLIAGH